MPPGIISFLPANGKDFGAVITNNKYFAGLNFTGSVPTFQNLWLAVANNLHKFISFPKMVGGTSFLQMFLKYCSIK